MGEVQDAEVLSDPRRLFRARLFSDPDAIHRYYERRHADAISAFAEDMNQLHIFWRPGARPTFPVGEN